MAAIADKSKEHRRLGCITGLAVLPAFMAAWFVLLQDIYPEPFDAMGAVTGVWLVWLALPAAVFVVSRISGLRRGWPALALIGATVSLLVWYTAWVVRPQAPTGQDHVEDLHSGAASLGAELTTVLTTSFPTAVLSTAFPNRATVDPNGDDWPCRDEFGRYRGAASGSYEARITPGANLVDVETLRLSLTQLGWKVQSEDHLDMFVGPARTLSGRRDGYTFRFGSVRLNGQRLQYSTLDGNTPCLRTTETFGPP